MSIDDSKLEVALLALTQTRHPSYPKFLPRTTIFHRLLAENESVPGRTILVGNSPYAKKPWFGELFGLALYNRLLTTDQVFQSFRWWAEKTDISVPPPDGVLAPINFSIALSDHI